MWAFGYNEAEAEKIWNEIPLDSDVVITHTPPKYHCDERKDRRAAGCEMLRNALWRVRPKLAICGHVHEGRGAETIRWDLKHSNNKYKEKTVGRWEDPGCANKKMSLVDLSSKGKNPIENDGSRGDWNGHSTANVEFIQGLSTPPHSSTAIPDDLARQSSASKSPKRTTEVKVPGTTELQTVPTETLPIATRGQGGIPPSQRCDLEALSGRMGRRETCIINAAIMASSYPHGPGGKKYNKPIVVDIDLPVWGT